MLERLTIVEASRLSELSEHVLRAWERRYGFPMPVRNSNGWRLYSLTQIAQLVAIKRLVNIGFRPGRVVGTHARETIANGDKSAYTAKQKRHASHIEKSYEKAGVSSGEAIARAWATVNKRSVGGKLSGAGRKTKTTKLRKVTKTT